MGKNCFKNGFKNGVLPLSKMDDVKTDSNDQQPDTLDISEQIKFNDLLEQIKEEQKR